MKKLACSLLTIIILFTISCEIGLGSSVDTEPPALAIDASLVDTVIADDFNIEGTYSDDGSIHDIKAILKRTDGYGSEIEIQGIFKEDLKKRGSGTWAIPVEAKSKNIVDGSYQATVYIKDAMGRITTQSTTFTIDNTPPVLILNKPNSKPEDATVSAYGQRIFLEGSIADSSKQTFIKVDFYKDAACTGEPFVSIDTGAIAPTDVNSNNARIAVFADPDDEKNLYEKIYQSSTKEGSKDVYIKITASDIAGNETTDFYFSKDLQKHLTKDKKHNGYGFAPRDIYDILNGTDALKTTGRVAEDIDIENIKQLLQESTIHTAMISVNPDNSPYFTVSGMKPLTKNGKDFESKEDGYWVINGAQTLEISVFMGSDSIELVDDENFYVYVLESDEFGNPKVEDTEENRIKLYSKSRETGSGINKKVYYNIGGKEGSKTTSGAYVFTVPMSKTIRPNPDETTQVTQNLDYKNYIIHVSGEDNEGNPIEPSESTGYGFHLSAGTGAPILNVEEPAENTIFLKKGSFIELKGSAKSSEGIPTVTLWNDSNKNAAGEVEPVKIADISLGGTEGELNEFNEQFYIEKAAPEGFGFPSASKTYSLSIKASSGDQITEKSFSLWYDVDGPEITINSILPIVKVDEKDNINGKLNLNGNIIDKFDQFGSAKFKVFQKTTANGVAEEVSVVTKDIDSSFDFKLDTTQLTDGKEATLEIKAYDRVGNETIWTKDYFVNQSTDKPTITISEESKNIDKGIGETGLAYVEEGNNLFIQGGNLVLSVADDDGVASARVIVQAYDKTKSGDQAVSPAASSQDKTYNKPAVISHALPTEVGLYQVTVKVYDTEFESEIATPNNCTTKQFFLRVTGNGPDFNITPDYEYIQTGSKYILTFNVTDEGNKPYKLKKNDDNISDKYNSINKDSFTYEYTPVIGEKSIKFTLIDKNTGFTNRVFQPKFDDIDPEVSFSTTPDFADTANNTFLFKGKLSDLPSGVETLRIKFDDTENSKTTNWINVGSFSKTDWNYEAIWSDSLEENSVIKATEIFKNVFTAENEKTVTVKAIDGAGNEKEATITFVYDKEAPEVTLATSETTDGKEDVSVSLTIKDSNPDKIEIKVTDSNGNVKDNINVTSFTGSSNMKFATTTIAKEKLTADGDYTITAKGIDKNNRESVVKSVTFKRDTSAPTVVIKNPSDDSKVNEKALTETTQISLRLDDGNGTGVEKVFYKFTHNANPGTEMGTAGDYTEEAASNGSFALDPEFVTGLTAGENELCEGKWFFHVYAIDGAGNISAVKTREFDIDMAAPFITTKLDNTEITDNKTKNKTESYKFTFKITESNALNATNPVSISVKKRATPVEYTIKDGTNVVDNLNEIIAGKDYTIEIPDADGLYTYTITVKDFVGKDAKVERVVQYDTTPPVAKHEIDTKQKDLYFRIGDYSNDAGDSDVGGKYSGGTYGNALTIQIRGYFDDEGSGINKFYYKTFNNREVMVDSTKATGSEPVEESETIYFNSPDVLKNYVIAKNTGTFFPLDEPEEKNVDYNTAAGKVTKAIVSNYKTTIKGFQEGKNYLVLVAEDNVGNTAVDYAEIEGVGKFYCYSLNVDITSPSIPTKEDENLFTNIDSTNTDSNVHFYIEGTVSDKPNKPNGSAGLASVVFTRDGGTGSIELKASDLTEPTTEDISAVPDDSTLKHWKVDVKSLLPSSGTAIISAKVTDNAGYEVSVPVANITVDRTAPEVIINSPVADAKIGATNLIINGTASDGNGAGISSDKLKVYYTKSESLGTATAAPASTDFGTAIAEKWVELGEVTSGAIWTYTKPDINATETIASNNENTSLYFMVSAKDKSGTGNVGYSSPRKVTVDRKAPVFVSGKFNGNETTSTDAWINNRTVNLEGSFTDTHAGVEGSGVTSIFYKFYETGDETSLANAVEKVIPTTDGSYNTNVNLDDSISNASFEIWAKDSAGNVSAKKTYLIKVDYTAPKLSASYYKKGTDSVTATGSTVYIKNQDGGTSFVLYGNYNDGTNQSGVKALVFKKNGTAFTPTVTYSATAIENGTENGTIPDDSTYAAYNNTAAAGYNSWKATFSLNETARITVEGEDNAGNKATAVSAIDVTFDEQLPELSNIKFTETNSGVTEEVYFSGDKYYINNSAEKGSTFTISGVATDNIGLQSISFDVVNTANTETVLTTPTINNPTGKWSFTVGNWTGWSTGAEVTVKVKDKAGNEDSKILTVEFDTKIPSISEVDLNGESLSANAWYNTQVIPIVVKATDTGSRISSVQYATLKATETNTTIAESKWTSLLSKTEGYTGSATFEDIGQNQKLFIRVTDNAGNVAYYKENNAATLINIDTEAPSVIPSTDNTFSTNGQGEGSISISGTARDAHSGLKNVTVTVEGLDSYSQTVTSFTGTGAEKTWTATIPVSNFENSTSGSYIIYAKATDNAGISNSQVSVGTISVDTKRPTITISSPAADAKVGPADLIITGTASDGTGSGLSSDENDKITLYYTTATPNASNSDNGIIQYTTVSGSTVISGITTGTNIANSWVALDGTLNTAATWTTTKTIPTTVAANNANTDVYFMASVKDNAGNIGYSVPRKITVDRKKPTLKTGTGKINGKTNANAWFNNRTINLSGTFEDDASGIQSVIYKVGNKDDQTLPSNGEYNTNITLDNDVNSTTVKIWAIDKAENVITSDDEDNYQSYTLKLDTMAPTIDLDYQGIQYSNRNSAYPIAITVSDGASECSGVASVVLSSDAVEETTINCKLEDGKYKAADIRSLLPTSGNATITILATDNAGNSRSKTTTIMVDTKEPTVTLDQPTNAKGTGSETYVNGDISISGTSHDDNIIEVVAGLCYMVDPESAPTKPGKAYITGIDSETEEVIWTAPTGWTKFDEVSMGYGSNTSKWSFQNLETNTNTFNDKTVYFTVAVVDKAGNIGFATPIKVIVDQDTNRPVIKITSMLLDGMTSTNRKGSTESEITGTVSDDDGVPRGLKYSLNGTDFITDGLVYSTSDGSFTLTLEDGEHTIYFEVETNEEISTGVYKKFTTMASPTDAQLVNTPKLTDRNGTTFGEKGTDTNKNTLYYMYIDKDPPEVKDFKYARAYDAETWDTSISGEYFGGPSTSDLPEGVEAKNTFYITQTAKDANGVKKVYLSIPADALDGNSNAVTSWFYQSGSVKKTIYTIGNHPSASASYWNDFAAVSGTKIGDITSVAENKTSVTIGSETYNRTAYIFALEDTESGKNKKEYHIWKTPEDKPIDVTGLASGEKTASLIAYDGTKQTAESKIILVDNSAPTITISAPETVSSSAVVNGSINDGTNTSVTTVSFAVTKTDVTDASTISEESWESESHAGSTQFKITFDGSEEEDSFETHAHLLKQYLINRGILTQNDINTKSAAARQLQPVHVWIRSVDNCNNVGYQKQLVYVDALGNIPTVSIAYPTLNAQDQTLGGTITIMGSSKDNIAPKYVWLQFDIDGDEKWTTADYNLIKDKYTFGNMKSNSDLASGAEVSEDDIADVGIKVDVDGSFSWSKDIDSTDLFSLSSQTANTITMWAYASDDDNGNGTDINVSRPDTRVFNIDKDNPYFKQDTIKLVQYSNQEDPDSPVVRELPYTEAMYIKGIWWIEGEVRDDSAGIREIKKSVYGNNNQYGSDEVIISSTGTPSTTSDYRFESNKETGENSTTIYNYNFKIKVGATTTSGRNRFKIKVKENKPGTDARDAEKEFILYYDNIKPTFADPTDSSDGIATEVKNDNGFYGLHSVAKEASENDSGVERVAVYFTRTITSGDNAGTYIFDPMYKRGAKVGDNDVSKIKITDSLVQDTTGDKLYWGSATAADTNGLDGVKVTLTAAVPSYVHVGGLAKIDDFVYRIQKISDDKETVTLSSAPNALPSDKKVYFAVANVVDNTKEEKKPASATILKTAYGYGYASNFSEDDSDKIMEYLKNVDSTTWNWNLYINSKNIPDGAITIHYVIFDKAGNTAYNSVDASVENNKPRLVGVTIGRDVNQDGSIATTSPETITYYENGTAAEDKPTLYKNGATTITIPNKITVKSKMEVTPEIVGGNGKIYYKIRKGSDQDYIGYGTGNAAIELMDGNNAYDNADWDNNKDHTDTSGTLVTQSATITHDLTASNKVRYQALISQNDSAWSLSYMLYDSKEAGEVNKVYINIPEIDFAVYDEEAPSVTITPFYWKQNGDIKKSSAVYEDVNNKTVARGHIELKADLSDIDTFNSTGVYDDDDKVSGIIKIEGTATDTRKLSALYISIPGMATYFGSTKANLTKKTVNSVDYYQISTYSGSAWTDKVGDLANYGFAFQTSDNSLTDTGHTVNWKFTWDTSKISTITAADVNIKVLAEDAASEASTDGNNKTAVGPLKVDVVPYITGISTELSKGNKNYPTVLSRSALGLYPVRRGSDITIEGFNFTGKNTGISINGTSIVDDKKTAVKVGNTNVNDTSKLIVKLDNTSLTSGGVVATVGTVSSLNNETSKTVGYNSEANGQNNDTLTDKRELHFVDVYTTDDKEDKRNLDMAISGNTINFSAGYKDSFFSTMKGASGTSVGTINNLRNSYTRYFDNAIAINESGTIFTVSACGDTLHTPVAKWTNGPSHFALSKGDFNIASGSLNEYGQASNNSRLLFLDSNWNGSNLNNLDRFKWPDIVVTGTDANTQGYISYYDTTQKLIKFRYFTSNSNTIATNLSSYREGSTATQYVEGAVNTNATYSQGYTAIAGANENSPYSAVGRISGSETDTAIVSWYDTTSGALKMKYNVNPAGSFSGYQTFKSVPYTTTYNRINKNTYTFNYYRGYFYSQTGENRDGCFAKIDGNYYKLEYYTMDEDYYFYTVVGYNGTQQKTGIELYSVEYNLNLSFDISVDNSAKPRLFISSKKNSSAGDMAHEFAYQLNLKLSGDGYGAYAEVDPKTNRITVRSMQTGTGSSISISTLRQGDTSLTDSTYLNDPVAGTGSAWVEKTIDSEGAGQYVAMKIDKKGGIHFAYYDTANGDLKYAYLSSVSATPVITTVDSYQQVGQYIDLALKENADGSQVTPYISYYSMSNADTTRAAKVARPASPIVYTGTTPDTSVITNGVNSSEKFTGAWEAFHVPTKGKPVQYRVNIGVKSNGEVYISYLDDRTIEYVKVD